MTSPTSCKIKYLVRGVNANRENKENLRNEILDMLPKAEAVTLLPVVEGFALDIEVSDIAPFSESTFESYLSDQVLLEAIELKCDARGQISLEFVKSNFF